MAGEPWNRVNIPFPSAVSSVRIPYDSTTDSKVEAVLVEKDKVLKLTQSQILQTEVRVLYELLYVLNNSYRGNRTFRGIKQVEQCLNRLKMMKLDAALQDLAELCPNRIQSQLGRSAGECDVPSQPFLEWLCLKVLGAGHLMGCTLSRCSRAFTLSKQQMKVEEFVILNVVITSMVSRLWVICRGILASLSTLYLHLLPLLGEVAYARPMSYLAEFSLPADMSQFLPESDAFLQNRRVPQSKRHQGGQQEMSRKGKEDLGVTIRRGSFLDSDLKPFFSSIRASTKGSFQADRRPAFWKKVSKAKTFTDLSTQLQERLAGCTSRRGKREKHILNFLLLKCQRMKCLEAEGHKVQRKLRAFKQKVHWALSPPRRAARSPRSPVPTGRNQHSVNRLHSVRSLKKSSALKGVDKAEKGKRRKKRSSVSGPLRDKRKDKNQCKGISETTAPNRHDDIDDIFASIGL